MHPPSNLDELRNISKTAFLSKCFESFLADWLLPIVTPYIDPCQYGMRGSSVSHYLLQLLKFTHEYLDLKTPHAVVVALVDQAKAFNRVSHQMVIEDLNDMKVPSWLLLILVSYLTGRKMIMTYKGVTASPRDLPGSSPQGAFLGIFLFIVKYNGVALRPAIPRNDRALYPYKLSSCESQVCLSHPKDTHVLYVDDLAEAEAVNLKKQLVPDSVNRPLPLNFHERTRKVFPANQSILQRNLHNVETFSAANNLKINQAKSKIIFFNTARKFDFPPEFSFSDGAHLEVLDSYKLVGVVISKDLRWEQNTQAIYLKSMKRMWLLRRLKQVDLEAELICEYYLKEIRSITEFGAVIWNSGLTKGQVKLLEKVQKIALKIILGDKYYNYKHARSVFQLPLLSERRLTLCTNFALKLYKSCRSKEFFSHSEATVNTRNKKLVVETLSNSKRAYNAPHKYLARLVNQNQSKIEKSCS